MNSMIVPSYQVSIDWSSALRTVTTASTVEVDVMPHLSRVAEGGSFPGYYNAIADLGAHFVRFSPWFGYPKVNVAELTRADCSNGGSSWNTTLLDGIVSDFMQAVCGPAAADGICHRGLSVVPQLSTMPAWMYGDGSNRTTLMPDDPWRYVNGNMGYYVVGGKPLVDPTCREMARYAARYVSWFTQGGMTDECGVRHVSNLHYKWELLSVLNEDEYRTPPGGGVCGWGDAHTHLCLARTHEERRVKTCSPSVPARGTYSPSRACSMLCAQASSTPSAGMRGERRLVRSIRR